MRTLRPKLPIIIILWLACWLRWHDPGLIPYTYDDASQIAVAGTIVSTVSTLGGAATDSGVARFWTDGAARLPLLSGGTTLGVERSALHAYVLAFFLGMGGEIEAAVWGVSALGVLAIALLYHLGEKVGGRFVGMWSALFLAVNPWLLYHDRRLWAHIYTLFSVLLLYLAWRVIVDRQARAALVVLPVLALQVLTHTLGVVQGLAWLGAGLAAPRAWLSRAMLYGALLAMLLVTPYVWQLNIGALVQNQAPAVAQDGSDAAVTAPTLAPRLANLLRTNHWTLLHHLMTGTGFSSTVGEVETSRPWWRAGVGVGAPILWIFLGAGLLRLLVDLFHPLRAAGARLILLWGLLPILLLGVQPVRIAFQYWTILLPLPALIAALGLEWLRTGALRLGLNGPVTGLLRAAPVAAGLVVAMIWIGSYGTVQELRRTGEAGTPLRFWRAGIAVAEQAARDAQTEEIRFAVSGLDPAFDGEAATVATLISNPPYARFVAPTRPPALLLNYARPSLYYLALERAWNGVEVAPGSHLNLPVWGERIWQGAPARGEPPAQIYRLPAYVDLPFPFADMSPAPRFDMGLALIAVDFPAASQADVPNTYTLVWRVVDPPDEARRRDFTAFNHILDATGAQVGQVDGLALLSRDWWPDDVLVQSYTLTLPPGELVWRTGLYSRLDGGRAYTEDWADAIDVPFRVIP